MATSIQNPNEPLAIDPPTYEYSWDFDYGMGPWTTWLAPSVVNEVGGQYQRFTRLNAPGLLDPNHLDGIGALRLVAHLPIPNIGSPGVLNLTDAEFQITIRGTDFHANGAKLVVWLCRYVPEEQVFKNYYVGLTVTNWANTGNDIAAQLTDQWQTITVSLSNDPDDWTYAGTNNSQQGDWGDRYQPIGLGETLAHTDATLHLVLVSDEPDPAPTGFLDIANITVRTQTPAAGHSGEQPEIFYGLEDEPTVGTLAGDPSVDPEDATFSLVSGSVTNGTVTIDPDTGAFSFTPNANFFGPTDFVGHAGFRYRVTDGTTTVEHEAFLFIGPVNDAPTASTAAETVEVAFDTPFEFSLFKGLDVDLDERLTYHLVPDGATNGTVTLNTENGRYVFTPTAGFSGTASFSYYVSDGQIDSAPKTVTLNVHTEADPPVRLTYDQAVDFLIAGDSQSFAYHAILQAQAGNANAAYHYGTFLGNGRFVPRDAALSAYYLGLAVGTVADASLQLADRYVTGDGVDTDFAAARALLEALPDNATALYRLGTLENLGLGAPRDDVRAVELYLQAANLGNADAMYTVGRRYLMAEGVAYSASDAYFWLAVGLRLNGGPALALFDNLLLFNMNQAAQDLTVEERAALDAAAAGWVPGQEPGVNDAPEPGLMAGDGEGAQTGLASTPFSGVVPEATDSDGDRLTYRLVAGSAQNGTVTIDADTGAFVFTPTGGYVGPASFQYVVSDGHSESAPTTVALDFHPATGTSNDTASTSEATTLAVGAEGGLLANDSVSDAGVSIAVTAVGGQPAGVGQPVSGSHGVITINADGSYSYTPAESTRSLLQGQTLVETFTYTITDGEAVSATGTLTITINGVAGTVVVTSGLYIGTGFDDVITGGTASDILLGQGGNDILVGGSGAANELYGGTGNDTFVVSVLGDTIIENADAGTDTVQTALAAYTLRTHLENLTFTGTGNFAGTGNAADNVLTGGAGADTLTGLAGADILDGGAGIDTLIGGTGDDLYRVDAAGDVVTELAAEGQDTVSSGVNAWTLGANIENLSFAGTGDFTGTGNALANAITGGTGNDTLDGAAGDDVLTGGLGDDTYVVDSAGDIVVEGADAGSDTIRTVLNVHALGDNLEALVFTGTGDFQGTGNALDNAITGGAGHDTLDGGLGADALTGGLGDDLYLVDDAGDVVTEADGEGADTVRTTLNTYGLTAHVEDLAFTGTGDFSGTGNDLGNAITGGLGNDTLDGAAGDDALAGGLGDDIYVIDSLGDAVIEADGAGSDTIRTTLNTFGLGTNVEGLTFIGTGDFAGTGNALDNAITGGAGDDTLDGGLGADTLTGGLGDDTYVVDALSDVVVEAEGEGSDTIRTALNALTLAANVEGLEFTGAGDFAGTGNALDNAIVGGTGHDTLDGGLGADALTGGLGDDLYLVDDALDVVTEVEGEGTDTVRTTLNAYGLAACVERLEFTGTGDFAGTGNDLANSLVGGTGNDTLDGGLGADTLTGGLGDDVYVVDDLTDVVVEAGGEGSDTVRTALNALTLVDHVEVLEFTGSGDFAGTGNALANAITGGGGHDTLDGAAGDDVLTGGLGDDIYVVDSLDDAVIEADGEGSDTIRTALNTYGLGDHVEGLTFTGTGDFAGTGNALDNAITGGAGHDTLDGGLGADALTGGSGDDLYLVDDAGDVVTEVEGEGTDTVRTTLGTYALTAHVEDLEFVGTGDFAGTGNDRANAITGGDGHDTLDGAAGDDILTGGLGDDTYVVDSLGDTVVEVDGEGSDTIRTTLTTYGLGDHVEGLAFSGTGDFEGTGNALDNAITGGAGSDTLDGGLGADTLTGGAGDDLYLVDDAGDVVTEAESEGTDTVRTALNTYGLTAHVEVLTFTGTGDFAGTGNARDNVITGGAGHDTLDGGLGADALTGGLGDDLYLVDDAGDVVTEAEGEGTDTVRTSFNTYGLAAHVERLEFTGTGGFVGTGNDLDNALVGGAGDDTLDGGLGADTLTGGLGDDTYVDDGSDTIVENADEGTDTVRTSLNAYTLGQDLENLTFDGTGAAFADFDGTGNALDNVITGGAGDDILDGAAGADTLIGGDGADLYIVDDAGDLVVEAADAGFDAVETTLDTYTLADNVEGLAFLGEGAFSGTGNAGDNEIQGGDDDDTLIGLDGADLLLGGAGADTLIGGLDDDIYLVEDGGDVVVEAIGEGFDTVLTTLNGYTLSGNVEALHFLGTGDFTGTGNGRDNLIVGGAGHDTLSGGRGDDYLAGAGGNDVMIGGLGADRFAVDDAGDLVTELAGEGIDTVETTLAAYTLTAHVENLESLATGDFAGTGNELANAITGGDGHDTLDGAAGDDFLTGGLGDDTYVVDSLDDAVIEADGEGSDTIRTALNTYGLGDHVERLTFTGTGDFAGTGNALDNAITGGAGHDTLDGGLGADALTGGSGDDLYLVDDAGDVVTEVEGEGTDTVRTTLGTYALTAHVEVLTFTGTGDFAGTGNGLDNAITGGAGHDTLDGAGGDDLLDALAGADTLRGGMGNDRFVVRDAGDVVVELADEGTDRVLSHLNAWTLTDNVETLEFVGSGNFVGTGNAQANTLIGGSGADTLDGGGGDDLMKGGAGNDLYLVAQAGDVVEELAGEGTDTVQTILSAYTLAVHVENLTYTGSGSFSGRGNALANTILGGAGDDSLSGGAGNDQLIGGAGIDTVDYSLAGAAVTVRLNSAQTTVDGDGGTDTLSGFENVTGSAFDDTLIGDSGSNVLTGGAGRDTLLGLGGNDILVGGAGLSNQMQGGTGDDRYVVSASGDSIIELSGEGTDTVETALAAYTLGNHLENLVSTSGQAFVGNGNALNNVITTGVGNDTLSGAGGADTLDAGGGDDLVRGGAGVDVMTGGTGIDTVDYSLAAARVVARLDQGRATDDGDGATDTFSGFENLTGSAFDDTLIGSSGNNTLTGGAGRDTLLGLGGDDILIGGAGLANQMQGGAGNDTYVISANDSLIELAGEGTDLVLAAIASFTLGTHIENLTYTGSSDFSGTGNGSDNVITGGIGGDTLSGAAGRDTLVGGAGHDVLSGGTGDDFMFGGTGNDRYSVDSAGDLITELAGEGIDTIETTLTTCVLGDNLENLTFLGTGGFIGTGNALDNVITGGGGNDTFLAGVGSDSFIGGAGIDTIDYSAVGSGVTVKLSALTASNDGQGGTDVLNSIENVIGTAFNDMLFGDGYANVLTGGAGWDVLLGLGGDDVLIGGDGLANTLQGGTGNDVYVVSALGDSVFENAAEGTDTVQTNLASYNLSANVEHLTYTGTGSFTGRGNALNNTITGGSGSDTVVVGGLRAQYLIETVTGGYRVTDLDAVADGNDGVDLLTGIEFVRFRDGSTLDLSTVGASSAPLISQKGAPGAAGDAFIGGPLVSSLPGGPEVLPGTVDDFLLSGKLDGPEVLPAPFDENLPQRLSESGQFDVGRPMDAFGLPLVVDAPWGVQVRAEWDVGVDAFISNDNLH